MASRRKGRKGLLPQTRAVRWLEACLYIADPCERKIGLLSKDWGGFADILAISPERTEVLLIQVTSNSNFASRVKKCLDNENAQRIIKTMPLVRVEVWGYRTGDPYSNAWPEQRLWNYYKPFKTQVLVPATLKKHLAARGALNG